jgi:hypothetical protein
MNGFKPSSRKRESGLEMGEPLPLACIGTSVDVQNLSVDERRPQVQVLVLESPLSDDVLGDLDAVRGEP